MSNDRLLMPDLVTVDHGTLPPLASTSSAQSRGSAGAGASVAVGDGGVGVGNKHWSFVHCRMYSIAEGIVDAVEKIVLSPAI
jgi:hypothetical protein